MLLWTPAKPNSAKLHQNTPDSHQGDRKRQSTASTKNQKLHQTTLSTQNKTEPIFSLEIGLKQFLYNKINLLSEA